MNKLQMYSCGIDSVEIVRFALWYRYPKRILLSIFNAHEIAYCMSKLERAPERFAVRFAAKEALYKALCSWQGRRFMAFRRFCKHAYIELTVDGIPEFRVAWASLRLPSCSVICSLTHTKAVATAFVVLH